jgi:hypothetical protein
MIIIIIKGGNFKHNNFEDLPQSNPTPLFIMGSLKFGIVTKWFKFVYSLLGRLAVLTGCKTVQGFHRGGKISLEQENTD